MFVRILVSGLFLAATTTAVGAPLQEHFAEHYTDHYESGQCGPNVQRFIAALASDGHDVDAMRIVAITNEGNTVFGMVNAESTRGYRPGTVTERNWYHHVIALDARGRVYDFDYAPGPQIVDMREYLETMFLNEPECNRPQSGTSSGEFCAGREEKLQDYKFVARPAQQGSSRGVSARMREVLNDWRVLWN